MTRRRDPHAATKAVGDVTPTHATRKSGLRPRRLLSFAHPIQAATKDDGEVAATYASPWARWLSPRNQSRPWGTPTRRRSEAQPSELQSLIRISYTVFWLKK